MKTLVTTSLSLFVFIFLVTSVLFAEGPQSTQESCWEYMVNNAIRTADEYAMDRNPQATFIKADWNLVMQYGGKYKGKYLLFLTSDFGGDTSFAGLLPSFDVTKSCKDVDDSSPNLWKIVISKFNGIPF